MFEREAREFHSNHFPHVVTRISLPTFKSCLLLTYSTRKSLEHQCSNAHSNVTKNLTRASRSNTGTVIKGVEKTKRKDRKRTTRKTTKKKEIDPTRWIECWDKVANATFYYHLDEDLSVRSSIVSVLPSIYASVLESIVHQDEEPMK